MKLNKLLSLSLVATATIATPIAVVSCAQEEPKVDVIEIDATKTFSTTDWEAYKLPTGRTEITTDEAREAYYDANKSSSKIFEHDILWATAKKVQTMLLVPNTKVSKALIQLSNFAVDKVNKQYLFSFDMITNFAYTTPETDDKLMKSEFCTTVKARKIPLLIDSYYEPDANKYENDLIFRSQTDAKINTLLLESPDSAYSINVDAKNSQLDKQTEETLQTRSFNINLEQNVNTPYLDETLASLPSSELEFVEWLCWEYESFYFDGITINE